MPTVRTVACLLGCVLLASCASAEPVEPATAEAVDGVVSLVGNDQLDFLPNDISSETGELQIALTCEGSVPHTIVITETDELVAECTRGGTGRGEVSLEPGTYEFFCSVPGHRRGGMVGTLRVTG